MPQKTILITGASDGLGAVAARQLAAQGERILLVGRSPEKTANIASELGAEYFIADFTKLDEVRRLAEDVNARVSRIDVLANNAGGIFGQRSITADGFEKTFQINHLAPFLLTHLLLDSLRAAQGSVVNTSSIAARLYGKLDLDDLSNERGYTANKAYGDAKLANILFAQGIKANYESQGISSVAFHPGVVATNFASDTTSLLRLIYRTPVGRLFTINAEEGGSNLSYFIGGQPGVTWKSGHYYDKRKLSTRVNPQIHDRELSERFWVRSAEMLGLPAASPAA